jgi:hypothetical protein
MVADPAQAHAVRRRTRARRAARSVAAALNDGGGVMAAISLRSAARNSSPFTFPRLKTDICG